MAYRWRLALGSVPRWALAALGTAWAVTGVALAAEGPRGPGPLGARPSQPSGASLLAPPVFAGSVRPFHGDLDKGPFRPGFPDAGPVRPSRPGRAGATVDETYTYADLLALGHPELVALLRGISFGQITDLFQYSEAARQFYDNDPRMLALFGALRESGQTFTADDDRGIETLGEVIRAGFYLAYFYPALARLNTWEYHLLCLPALQAIADNPAFAWGTRTQSRVLTSLGLVMANGLTSVGLIDRVRSRLGEFNDQAAAWLRDPTTAGWDRRRAVHYLGLGVDLGLGYAIEYGYGRDPTASPFYGQLGGYLNEMGRLALFGQLEDEYEGLVSNAGYWLAQLGPVAPGPLLNQILTQMIANYGRWTRPSLQAVVGIVEHFGGVDADGNTYELEQVKREVHDQVLPLRYSFDGGATLFETGPRVDPVKVRRLYWAMKEVKAQFHREIGHDAVLEPGRTDDRLTAVIFDSPADYTYNSFLNGLSTDNGGIYIEQWGTLFTYERTPAESIYSLEELLRHEYAHYLQGRFLVFGPWGGEPLYDHERLTWLEEGQAELLAGSTRTQGIRWRRALARQIAEDGPAGWMRLADVLHARYDSGFTFYRYAMAVLGYLREAHPERRTQLIERLLARDGAGFDLLIGTLSADAALEAGFRQYLQAVATGAVGVDPATAHDYLYDPLAAREVEAIVADVVGALPLPDAVATVFEFEDVPTVAVEGTVTGTPSAGVTEDWREMEARVQDALRALEARAWPGYRTFTSYFVDHQTVGDGYQYRVAFSGKLGSRVACTSVLSEADATFVSGGGTGEVGITADNGCLGSAVSTVPWLRVTQGALGAGSRTVRYLVEPNGGGSRTGRLVVAGRTLDVTQLPVPEGLSETEPNDVAALANGPVVSGTLVTGAFPGTESDYYYFDVSAPGPVHITLTPNGPGATWVLAHSASPDEWVAYGVDQDGRIVGGFTATLTGRYHLIAYRLGGTVTSYGLVATYPTGSECRHSLGATGAAIPAAGAAVGVGVTQGVNGCLAWTAMSHTPWIQVTGGATGSGNGTVQLSVLPNRVAPRTGTVTIGGQTFTVTQAAPPPAVPRPDRRRSDRPGR